MDQPQSSKNDNKIHRMETRKKPPPAHLSPQTSTDMTYEDPSTVALATQTLVDFAMTKGHTIHSLTHMTRSQLAEFLRDFYGKAKSRIDESSMGLKDIRAGLHRFFLEEIAVDILRDKTFELANATFDLALRTNAPRKCHRMRIEMEDLRKIYLSEAMELNTPESLQNKVFFDVNLYICNRSKDCLRLMKKEDFEVASDVNGRRYVCLKDPAKFGGPDAYNADRMYERPGDPRCPVKSFLKYVTHLHPMNDNFWQRPKRNVTPADYVWYDHSPIGSSTLNKIMQRISLMAGMCDSYTTHSIRSAYIPLVESICQEAIGSHVSFPLPVSVALSGGGSGSSSGIQSQDSRAEPEVTSGDESSSVTSEPKDVNDPDGEAAASLREAKMKVLEQIQKVMVRDIQKFVDWLKTVRVEYNGGEMRVLCSPVDKQVVDLSEALVPTVEPTLYPDRHPTSILRQPSKTLEPVTRQDSYSGGTRSGDFSGVQSISIKQVEFRSFGDTHCSLAELAPTKITIPTEDTLLVTGIPENVQLMLHKRQGALEGSRESIADRIFYSENEMDVAEVAAHLGALNPVQRQENVPVSSSYVATSVSPPEVTVTPYHCEPPPLPQRPLPVPQNSFETKSKSELIKTKKYKSVTYLEPTSTLPVPDLKRVSSTGTPMLKRQANVIESPYGEDQPLAKRAMSEDPSVFSSRKRDESLEAKRLRADRLDDSLRMHQEILKNSPLLKKQMDRHGTGFRHSYKCIKTEPSE